ncbi:uncharacterized protein LOC131327000 isoform X2 [Rhododendron vialii]|uniref:uncharacterized protein LOC131327000 isoform X2 n=1 Tax=Rhododendron vialii TaxID=182163 RepID=UPI00265E4083|nr:uncharacterized protein LOC131327000 isoform X2 [Rhododendron vialii]
MDNEVFQIMRTPHTFGGVRKEIFSIAKFVQLKDKLCLIDYHDEGCLDVWVLNENEKSWTYQFNIGCFPRIENIVRFGDFWRIILCWMCEKWRSDSSTSKRNLFVHGDLGSNITKTMKAKMPVKLCLTRTKRNRGIYEFMYETQT